MPDLTPPVVLVDPQGVPREVAPELVTAAIGAGWRSQTQDDVLAAAGHAASATDYGGVRGAIGAGAAGAARGLTLGLSDVAARAIGGDDAAATLRGLRAENPGISTGSEIAGAVAPSLIGGGAVAPASFAADAGRGASAAIGGGLRGAIVGGAVEGGLFGAGQGVSELALSQDPLTIEHVASSLSSNALYGAALGGAAGGALKGAEIGLRSAKRAVDAALLDRSAERAMKAVAELEAEAAASPAAIGPETDVSALDRPGLKLAEKSELERIDAARQPMRERFVDELTEAHQAREPNKEWLSIVADRNPDKYARENAKVIFNVDRRIRNLLDNRAGLIERPGRATEWLQQEAQALEGLMQRGRADLERFQSAAAAAPDAVREEVLANKLPGFVVGKGGLARTSPLIDDAVVREVAKRFPRDADGVLQIPRELAGFADNRLGEALARNRDLQATIANLQRAPASERLNQIEAAREALSGKTVPPPVVPETSPIGSVLSIAARAAGPLGAVAEKAAGALGGLRNAAGAGVERAARAASTFLDVAAPAAGRAARASAPVATAILGALRYGDEHGGREPAARSGDLTALYRARANEIRAQVQIAPDGSYQMRPEARARMAERLAGLGAVDPIAADRLESAGARRIAWLASQLPRRPDVTAVQVGPDTWTPSDIAMRTFARKAAAAEDPIGVLERAAAGHVTAAEIAAVRATAPEILQAFINEVAPQLAALPKKLPYQRRLALSMLTGQPIDPAMHPAVLRELQSMYVAEPGTAGGTQEPAPQPQFGSVKRSDPGTPAQRREGLAP